MYVGLDGSLDGGAIGSVNESRFAFREAVEVDRDWRVGEVSLPEGVGGGGMTAESTRPSLRESKPFVLSSWLADELSGVEVEANMVVVAADVAMDEAAGFRSAAEERRRICWCESMSRRRWRRRCSEWQPCNRRRFCKGVAGARSALGRRRRAEAAEALARRALVWA